MKKFSLSFEFFPPKTLPGSEKLIATAGKLATLKPDFFSVTFGAGGSTREGTLKTVTDLMQHTSVTIAPHLSCVGATESEIIALLHEYKARNIHSLVALRGDLPSGMGYSGELRYASELVKLIRTETQNFFDIHVAVYPEIHPQAKSYTADLENFKRKIDAGANSAITQYFYNADAYFYYRDYCQHKGIMVPIIPGIMPITHYSNLTRFSEVCGAEIPRWIRRRLEEYADDADSLKAFGLEVVHDLCQRLMCNEVPGLHFYTLNNAEASFTLVDMLNLP